MVQFIRFYSFRDCDEKTFKGLSRILEVWESRNIYDKAQIASYKQALGTCKVKNEASNREVKPGKGPNKDDKVSQQQKKEQSSNKTKETKDKKRDHNDVKSGKRNAEEKGHSKEKKARFTQPPPKPATLGRSSLTSKTPETNNNNRVPSVDPEVLIKALQDLENSASSDAAVREKIASLPPEVSDSTLLDKIRDKGAAERLSKVVDEACSILADYNSRLAQELEDRKNISTMLNNFTQNQKEALALAEQKLEEYKDKLKKVTQVRNELKSHLQNLPDLSRLPSVTGLAPLPSACDLFNVGRNAADRSGSLSSSTSPNESSASPADDIGTPNSGIS